VIKLSQLVLVAACLSALSGCATTKYQCPSPTGVACMGARDVYTLTDAPGKNGMEAATGVLDSHGKVVRPSSASHGQPETSTGNVVIPLPKPGDVIPIREQARVMRIWIAPWEDSDGNLVMATRIYTEIEPRKWSVGEPSRSSTSSNFFPMQVDSSQPPATTSTVSPDASAVAPGTEPRTP